MSTTECLMQFMLSDGTSKLVTHNKDDKKSYLYSEFINGITECKPSSTCFEKTPVNIYLNIVIPFTSEEFSGFMKEKKREELIPIYEYFGKSELILSIILKVIAKGKNVCAILNKYLPICKNVIAMEGRAGWMMDHNLSFYNEKFYCRALCTSMAYIKQHSIQNPEILYLCTTPYTNMLKSNVPFIIPVINIIKDKNICTIEPLSYDYSGGFGSYTTVDIKYKAEFGEIEIHIQNIACYNPNIPKRGNNNDDGGSGIRWTIWLNKKYNAIYNKVKSDSLSCIEKSEYDDYCNIGNIIADLQCNINLEDACLKETKRDNMRKMMCDSGIIILYAQKT